jgi:hypothetical protein
MTGVRIQQLKISLNTSDGEYGFECEFKSGLNIIRGNNSSGKSTLVNALIYSLGMEEILGGKGEKTLPYALKDYVENDKKEKIRIVSSYVYLQISNVKNDVVTLKRAINSSDKNTKLIEIIHGAYLANSDDTYKVSPKYLHDKGSAQNSESGFFSFLEGFVGFNLPSVPSSNGGEVKLYIQTIFSALLIEQKRGWTDYIANTPYFAIRDVRTKIVEFLLGLDVFENDRLRASLISNLTDIQSCWAEERVKVRLLEEEHSISVIGVKSTTDDMFDSKLVRVAKDIDGSSIDLNSYIVELVRKIEAISESENRAKDDAPIELVEAYKESKEMLDKHISMFDSGNAEIRLSKLRLAEYLTTKSGIEKDLEKNRIAKKLKQFGAEQGLSLAHDSCPACHQHIDDSLFLAESLLQPMSIEENVKYLDSQKKMVTRYVEGLEKTISKLESQSREYTESVSEKRAVCLSLKKQIRLTGSATETDLRVKLQLENKIDSLLKAEMSINISLERLADISNEFKSVKAKLADIPERKSSNEDLKKYKKFQEYFRHHANSFGYKSAPTSDIEINKDTLFPYLSGLELRQVNTDIKSDSSASDFVRLIWAYVLSIYSVSEELGGNHTGLILLDEPGQHSMGVTSVNALLKTISSQTNLQGIVAASFAESDEEFEESVIGVNYHMITCGYKLLGPATKKP